MNLFSLASVKEIRNPIKPMNISVLINPAKVKTKKSSRDITKSVEKIGNNAFSNYNLESFFLIKKQIIKKDILMRYCERF